MKQFKIAVVGCGGVSQMHFDGYVTHPDRLHISAACDLDEARVQAAQHKYEFDHAFTSVEEMIEGADWEVAVVCTPTPVRKQVVQTLAAAGKHILVEKPFSDTYAEAEEMVAIARDAGVKLAVDQNFRYHFPYEHARELVEEGLIGEVISIMHEDLMFRQDQGWRTQTERHAMSVMGVHWLDGMRWIVQSAPESIYSITRSSPAIDCVGETEAFTSIVFQNGVIGSYVETFTVPRRRAETIVSGVDGALILTYDGIAHHTKENRNGPKQTWENPYRGAAKPQSAYACLNELLVALEEGREPTNSGEDNLKTVALLDGAYRSAKERREIRFGETEWPTCHDRYEVPA
jgi:D-apiose dehydrogenase